MKTEPEKAPVITDPAAAQRSKAGHWAETQVIESIKDAALRRKDPMRVFNGEATQPIGGMFYPVAGEQGGLLVGKLSLRSRLKRLFSYFRG
ncbi:MAG: hypothetical protein ACI9UA_005269 [Pseudoalteromonas tetraodonis]|jgi:hypothetical protein